MKLNIKKIKENLKTKELAQNIIYSEKINSTQDEAKKLSDLCCNGTFITADIQTKGKGTHGRIWYGGEYENICGTFVLKPNCHISKISNLTILVAECILSAIKKLYNISLDIKYPNDIICNGKKIAGILTESLTYQEIVQVIYIGIGMNINQVIFNKELENIATSLKKEYNLYFQREKIIATFFNEFELKYNELICEYD